jgi:hypothetical protein
MSKLLKFVKRAQNKIGRKVLDVKMFTVVLSRILKKKQDSNKSGKSIWLDINDNYERYTYILTKYFEIEGFKVYMKANPMFILSLGDPYAKSIVEENQTIFSFLKPEHAVATFSDKNSDSKLISNDYFSTIYNKSDNSYHIPLGMHPNMYKGLWNANQPVTNRIFSVFFAGDFNEVSYKRLKRQSKFKMADRITLKYLLKTLPNTMFPKTYQELNELGKYQIHIVDRTNFDIPQEALRSTISQYNFFIACPGVAMPLSHNIFEAMSVGTTPILHKDYANMFNPALIDHENALIYEDETFLDVIKQAIGIPDEDAAKMNRHTLEYYNQHLTPKAIVQKLIDNDTNTYYLNAERASVARL